MSTVGALAVSAIVAVTGLWVLVSGWLQPAPTLARTIHHLQRAGPTVTDGYGANGRAAAGRRDTAVGRLGRRLVAAFGDDSRLLPSDVHLRLVGRPLEHHVLYLTAAACTGLLLPGLLVAVLQRAGVVGFGWYAPLLVGVAGAALGPVLVHSATIERAQSIRADLRYQVSAYLDVVTMLLAGNTGHEGALEQAAGAGDGRLFAELRRRMRESGARGSSLTDALHRTAIELGLDELQQIAATTALSAAEGAPVARTLAAKCATLRGALATEQETEARLRTSRLTTPIVGMALIFMALVMYPALNFT